MNYSYIYRYLTTMTCALETFLLFCIIECLIWLIYKHINVCTIGYPGVYCPEDQPVTRTLQELQTDPDSTALPGWGCQGKLVIYSLKRYFWLLLSQNLHIPNFLTV